MQTTRSVPQSETRRVRPAEPVFALFRRDADGRENFVQFCRRSELAQWAGWPTVRATPVHLEQLDQLVLL